MQNVAKDAATEWDVAYDLVSLIDEAPAGRLIGSEETTLEAVAIGGGKLPRSFTLTLDNGQTFRVSVEEA